jgi:hypothetical protein
MNYDPKELEMGIAAEKDHEQDKAKMLNPDDSLAKTIALRHLKEDPRYYSKLKAAGLDKETSEGALTPLEAGMAECDEMPNVAIISIEEPAAAASQVPLSSSNLGKGGKPKPLAATGLTAPETKVINNKNTVSATKTPSMIATPSSSDAIDHFCGQINNGIEAQEEV